MTHTEAGWPVPPLACDCHMHVFGGPTTYPLPELRSYSPREAPLTAWRAVAAPLGFERVVVVQPSVYGADNRCTLDALRAFGPMSRGVAQIDAATTDAMLQELHAAGVRGIRLNPKSVGLRDRRAVTELLEKAARRIGPLGWHVQIYGELAMVTDMAPAIAASSVPVVLDHMGGARSNDDPMALRRLLDLLAAGRCWVKLSGAYRVSRQESGFTDASPITAALVRANPERLVWGSDWPHTAHHAGRPQRDAPPIQFRPIDVGGLLDRLRESAGDDATFTRILSTNPERLYGF